MTLMRDNRSAYREAARRILKQIPDADVEKLGNVHPMQDGSGAFVEAVVWVPAAALLSDRAPELKA